MKTWIVTGGTATGKSSLSQRLEVLVPSSLGFSADDCVAALYGNEIVLQLLKDAFGDRLDGGTTIPNRHWIRTHVLPDSAARAELESILHPMVLSELQNARSEADRDGAKVFVAEVPLHYEIGGVISADLVIVVAASRSVQVRRMMENRGLEEQTVNSFLDAQWPITAKAERADVVIWNDGTPAALQAQLLTLLSSYPRLE